MRSLSEVSTAASTKLELLVVVLLTLPPNLDKSSSQQSISNPGAIGQHSFWITLQMLARR